MRVLDDKWLATIRIWNALLSEVNATLDDQIDRRVRDGKSLRLDRLRDAEEAHPLGAKAEHLADELGRSLVNHKPPIS